MDTIFISGLSVHTVIGVYAWERAIRQRIILDLAMDFDIRAAASSDDVAQTLDYKRVSERVIAFAEAAEYRLVETLAEQIAALILQDSGVARVRVRVNKPHALRDAAGVGVEIERRRES